MSSPAQSLKSRKAGKRPTTPNSEAVANGQTDVKAAVKQVAQAAKQQTKEAVTSQWDYKVALLILTLAAFATRFWQIQHPDQVVFDEVHFGKVCS